MKKEGYPMKELLQKAIDAIYMSMARLAQDAELSWCV